MFAGVNFQPFEKKIYLASPTMHGREQEYINEAFATNWVSTVGENITASEQLVAERIGKKYAVALTTGTAALHLAVRLAGITKGTKVFCSDLTFAATVNPIVYEGGIPVLIDSERDTWNIDPAALEKAFSLYPDVKHVVIVNLFGTPGKFDEICEICRRHGATLIEDAAESFGATYRGVPAGSFGDIGVVSFNGNKIITGSSGGMLLTDSEKDAARVRKWSTQCREPAPWYQHTEIGNNYRMSNIIAGVIRGQMEYLDAHVAAKKAIYERYREGLRGYPVSMNPYDPEICEPNFWLSCLLIDSDAMCEQKRGDLTVTYKKEKGKTCPTEILETLCAFNAEGRPLWKPMHMQPIFAGNDFVSCGGSVGTDLFERGLCLPSDINMTAEQQDKIIEIVRRCFD